MKALNNSQAPDLGFSLLKSGKIINAHPHPNQKTCTDTCSAHVFFYYSASSIPVFGLTEDSLGGYGCQIVAKQHIQGADKADFIRR